MSLVRDQRDLAIGFGFFTVFFVGTWTWSPLAYIEGDQMAMEGNETLKGVDFYPGFTLLNSWMGVLYFITTGFFGSRKFRTFLGAACKRNRKEMDKSDFDELDNTSINYNKDD